MSHEPFATWLFAREDLSPEQRRALQEHLHHCPACAALDVAWRDVERQFRQAPLLDPAPGFADRWLARERAERLRRARRLNRWVGGGVLLGLLSSTAALAALWWQAPARPLTLLAFPLARGLALGRAATVLMDALANAAPGLLLGAVALVALGTLALLLPLAWTTWHWAFATSR